MATAAGMNETPGISPGSAYGPGNIAGRLDRIRAITPLSGSVLVDVGAGNGTYTVRMVEGFDTAYAIDISQKDVAAIPGRLSPALARRVIPLCASAHEIPLDAQVADVVTMIQCLEHVGEPLERVAGELWRLLRPGGTAVITTPNRLYPLDEHGYNVGGKHRPEWALPFVKWAPPLHRRVSGADAFTMRRLDRIFGGVGFTRVGATRMMPPIDRRPQLRPLRPVLRTIERTPLLGSMSQTNIVVYRRPGGGQPS